MISTYLDIVNDESLYRSEFCGSQYWGPTSTQGVPITGFDLKGIDRPVGGLFSPTDIKIFETLFWPFSKLFRYTNLSQMEFEKNIEDISGSLEEPLDFELLFSTPLVLLSTLLQDVNTIVQLKSKQIITVYFFMIFLFDY